MPDSREDMQGLLRRIAWRWTRHPGAGTAELRRLATAFGQELPDDYRQFLEWSDGGEGYVGTRYLMLWPTGSLIALTKGYRIEQYLPGVLAIGTDGASVCFALDYPTSATAPPLISCDLGDLGRASATIEGGSFAAFIARALGL